MNLTDDGPGKPPLVGAQRAAKAGAMTANAASDGMVYFEFEVILDV